MRLVIEDVTLIKAEEISVHVRFRGGATRSFTLPRLRPAQEEHRTPEEVVREIDRLLDEHTYGEIATILNERGLRSGTGKCFHAKRVAHIQDAYNLPSRRERLRRKGLLTNAELKGGRWSSLPHEYTQHLDHSGELVEGHQLNRSHLSHAVFLAQIVLFVALLVLAELVNGPRDGMQVTPIFFSHHSQKGIHDMKEHCLWPSGFIGL